MTWAAYKLKLTTKGGYARAYVREPHAHIIHLVWLKASAIVAILHREAIILQVEV